MENRHQDTVDLLNKPTMSIQQKIRKAKNIFVWVLVYDSDGEYIQTSKYKLVNGINSFDDLDESKVNLREDGNLYVN